MDIIKFNKVHICIYDNEVEMYDCQAYTFIFIDTDLVNLVMQICENLYQIYEYISSKK